MKPAAYYQRARKRALRLMKRGLSCRTIAKDCGVSTGTVSNWARDAGHEWGSSATAKAAETNRAYGSERRAKQILTAADRVDGILERMVQPHVSFNFGGRDNGYNEHQHDRPDSKTLRDYASSISTLVTAMKALHTFDSLGAEDLTDVQRYLLQQKGGKP